jgi:DNA-binding NtrC family response regulator
MKQNSTLIASANNSAIKEIQQSLAHEYNLDIARDPGTCLRMFRRKRYEFSFIDISFLSPNASSTNHNHTDYKKALEPFWEMYPSANIIVLAAQKELRQAVQAVKAGASDYLTYPLDPIEIAYIMEYLSEFQKIGSELDHLRDITWGKDAEIGARTNSPMMRKILEEARAVAPTKTTVLLNGETGTGKGVLAKFIHTHSNRAPRQFVAVHCGAVPDSLLESEFFGHEKGAFTSAIRRKLGKFEIGDGGTIFLDEIGTITPAAQIKMLQVLQEKSFSRVGGEATIEVDVRLIAASNMSLKKLCQEGQFREDLYYRLNVFPIDLPPLRERLDDIPLLIDIFLDRLSQSHGKDIRGATPEVIEAFQNYSWPGNIRELENLIERAYILEQKTALTSNSFPGELFLFKGSNIKSSTETIPTMAEMRNQVLENAEIHYLREILSLNKGRIDKTASMAGLSSRQLHNLMLKYNLHKEDFK